MVRIVDYKLRLSKIGDPFFALIVQGGIQLVKSQATGLYYATTKKASLACTFDEATCKTLVGSELDGSIEKVDCDPYEMVNEETGETRILDYRWVFVKTGDTVESFASVGMHEEEPELV